MHRGQSSEIAANTFNAIYKAAITQDEAALTEILETNCINIFSWVGHEIMPPIQCLAAENNQDAVQFLLEHGANIHFAVMGFASRGAEGQIQVDSLLAQGGKVTFAVIGYAKAHAVEQVDALLAKGASRLAAAKSYASAGYDDEAEELLPQVPLSDPYIQANANAVDCLVGGYARAGNTDKVNFHLKNGAKASFAAEGFAVSGWTEHVDAILQAHPDEKTLKDAVRSYAFAGRDTEIQKLLEKNLSIRADLLKAAAEGYARAGNLEPLRNVFRESPAANHRDLLSAASSGFSLAYHKEYITMFRLFDYGNFLKEHGHQEKGEKAKQLAIKLANQVSLFLINRDSKASSTTISKLMTEGHKTLGEDRQVRDILAHIAFACTGIGLIIIIGHRLLSESKSWFLNSTLRQDMLATAGNTIQPLLRHAPKAGG